MNFTHSSVIIVSIFLCHAAVSACIHSYNILPARCLSYNIICVRFEVFTAVVMKILFSESDINNS